MWKGHRSRPHHRQETLLGIRKIPRRPLQSIRGPGHPALQEDGDAGVLRAESRGLGQGSGGDTNKGHQAQGIGNDKPGPEQSSQESQNQTAITKCEGRGRVHLYEWETEEDSVKKESKPESETSKLGWARARGDGMLKESRAKSNDPANLKVVGGMRNLAETVAGMPGALNLGIRFFAARERFTTAKCLALETVATHGTKDCVEGGRTGSHDGWQPADRVGPSPTAQASGGRQGGGAEGN